MTERKTGSVDEATESTQRVLGKWAEETDDPVSKAVYTLRSALDPGWNRWVKESGTNNENIVRALIDVSAQMMVEVIKNVAKAGGQEKLAETMARVHAKSVMDYVGRDSDVEPGEITGFRRKDS